jgi:plasmid stabilization system protein ParE
MKVEWTLLAESERDKIAEYILDSFGVKSMKKFIQEVRKTTKMLRNNPDIAPKDPLFEDRSDTYRSVLINNLSKLVYRVDGETIYVVGFWDCRSDSEAQAKRVK